MLPQENKMDFRLCRNKGIERLKSSRRKLTF